MPSAKILGVEIPRQYLEYVIAGIGGGIQISGLIPPAHPMANTLKNLLDKKGDFVEFECRDSRETYIGGIAEIKDVHLKDEPAGLRYRIFLQKQ